MLIAKVLRHVADYLKAVKSFGPGFCSIRIDGDADCDDRSITQAKLRRDRRLERTKTLAHGRIAYKYIFLDGENDLGFIPVCKALGFNAATFRHRLKNMTKKEAAKLYVMFLRGERKGRQVKENQR